MRMKISGNARVLIVFVLITIAIRFFSFFSSVLDHDESTYLLVGRELAHGKSLYVDVVDSKPVGIFFIYTLFQYVFGYSIFLKRLFVSVIVAATAYFLYLVSQKFFQHKRVAISTGAIYIYLVSTWNYFGLSPNTELFFNFFTVAALIFFLRKSYLRYFFAGFLFGLGFIIKYLVLFDFILIGLFFYLHELSQNNWKFSFKEILPYKLACIGFVIPFVLVNLYFYLNGHFDAFRYITYEFPGRYMDRGSLKQFLLILLDFTGRFFPVTIPFFFVLFSKSSLLKTLEKRMLICWIFAILLAMYLPGRGFSHYTIQLMLPVCLMAGIAFHPEFHFDRFTRVLFRGRSALVLLILLVAVSQFAGISGKLRKPDEPRVVAEYLKEHMATDDQIYVSNYEHILYYLLDQELPTKYVHATILSQPALAYAFDVDPEKEIKRIIDSKPKYVLVLRKFDLVENLIKQDYFLDHSFFDGKVLAYRRKS